MEGRRGQHLLEGFLPEHSPIHDQGDDFVLGPAQRRTRPVQHAPEPSAQVFVVIGAFEVNRLPRDRVEKIAVQSCVSPTNRRAPAFEHGGHPGGMLGVGVQGEITLPRRADPAAVPAQERGGGRPGGQFFESPALGSRPAHRRSQQHVQVFAVQIFGLLDVDRAGQPAAQGLPQPRLGRLHHRADGPQRVPKQQQARVLAPRGLSDRPGPGWEEGSGSRPGKRKRGRGSKRKILPPTPPARWGLSVRKRPPPPAAQPGPRRGAVPRPRPKAWLPPLPSPQPPRCSALRPGPARFREPAPRPAEL